MHAKVINEKTKQCEVGIGTNAKFYRSIGMIEMDVEQSYDGSWYVKGYAPKKTQELKEKEVRSIRNRYLEEYVDYYQEKPLLWAELDDGFKQQIINYRQYLKNYPESSETWFENNPLTFEEWNK